MGRQKPDYGALVKSLPKPAPPSTNRLREAPTPTGVGESVNWPDTDLFRRAVVLASGNPQISIFRLEQGLSISLDEAEHLMNQLVKAGIIERPAPSRAREIESESNRARSFFIKDPSYSFRKNDYQKSADETNEENIDNAKLQKSLKDDTLTQDELTTYSKIADIENIDSRYSDVEIENLVKEALSPLLARAELNEAQKSEIIRVSSTSFKSCLDGHHGVLGGKELVLPHMAPAMWKHDRVPVVDTVTNAERMEDAGEFTRRVYGPWLGNGMTRNLLRKLDNPLFQALYRAYGANLPDDLPLPTKREENDRWVARVEKEGLAAVIPDGASSDFALREAQRLLSARQRRNRDKS